MLISRISKIIPTLLILGFVTGCANSAKRSHPNDPLEPYNRAMFGFNRSVDRVVTKPIAYLYFMYVPNPVQEGIGNFFDNLREVQNVTNDLLQLKFSYAARDASRFFINSTLGLAGIFDVAGALGLEHRKEDFGQTLYHWGYEESAYFMMPFLGPSTIRDTAGIFVDYYALSAWPWIEGNTRYYLLGLDFIDLRSRLLRNETVLDILAVDEYVFIRDAYFQRRKYLFNQETDEPTSEEIDPYNGNDTKDPIPPKEKSSSEKSHSHSGEKTAAKSDEKSAEKSKTQ